MTAIKKKIEPAAAGILERIVSPGFDNLSPDLARRILALKLDSAALERINVLSVKARAGQLSTQEDEELETYISVGHLLSIIKSKARKFLKGRSSSR